MEVSILLKQFILLLAHVFNATSYFRRKSILEALIDGKLNFKELLKQQSVFETMFCSLLLPERIFQVSHC